MSSTPNTKRGNATTIQLILLVVIGVAIGFGLYNCRKRDNFRLKWTLQNQPLPKKLSAWGLFKGKMSKLIPAKGFVPYALNTPLFSDYAAKNRMLWVPPGTQATYDSRQVFSFPKGSLIAKTFSFPKAKNLKGPGIVETRLLLHTPKGWIGVSYMWNKDQTDATIQIAGGRREIVGIPQHPKAFTYVVPNMNECINCHEKGKQDTPYGPMAKGTPIGPKARNLNGNFTYPGGKTENQLLYMQRIGFLKGLPTQTNGTLYPNCNFAQNLDPTKNKCTPFVPPSNDTSFPLNDRARAYLDNNCAHCHQPGGAAETSGMWLDYLERTPSRLGICKSPAAAGKATRCYRYDICSGDPAHSIMMYRISSNHTDIRMPELGRMVADCNAHQGVELIKAWIASLKTTNPCSQGCNATKTCTPVAPACGKDNVGNKKKTGKKK
jgi:uncharacterized repeat protein (TIGR03806 family)